MRVSEPTLAARALSPVLGRLASLGVDVASLLARRGIEQELFSDDEARIAISKTEGLWDEAAELTADDAFGIHLAESMDVSSFGLFSYLAVSSATWGFALGSVCNYFGLIGDGSGYDVSQQGAEVRVRVRPWPGVAISRQVTEFSLAVLFGYGRRHLKEPLVCHDVSFAHARPKQVSAHEDLFRTRVAFGAADSGFSFDRRFLDVPLASADPKLTALLKPNAVAELARREPGTQSAAEQVRPILLDLVRRGAPSLEAVAQRLAQSARTLQRNLAQEGTSFRELVGQAQSVVAAQLLRDPKLGVAEVAALLGFSESAAFHRSFKRWTGLTPLQHRQAQRQK